MARTTTKLGTLLIAGGSGRHYEFRVYVWSTMFKAVPGVYVVASRSRDPGKDPKYKTLFVGAAADLSKALTSHPRLECFEMHYANVVGALREDVEGERERIVADLVTGLSPPCNSAEDAW